MTRPVNQAASPPHHTCTVSPTRLPSRAAVGGAAGVADAALGVTSLETVLDALAFFAAWRNVQRGVGVGLNRAATLLRDLNSPRTGTARGAGSWTGASWGLALARGSGKE